MKGGRALSPWNKFVSKVYHEGKKTDPDYEFKQALKDASKRKNEMGSSASGVIKSKKNKKGSKKSKKYMVAGTRKHRRH